MLGAILSFLSGGFVQSLSQEFRRAYEAKINATTNEDKLKAEVDLAWIQAQQSIIKEEQARWYTAWIRPMLALPVVVFWWKVLIWDTVLGWGVTAYPGELITWFVTLVPVTYFVARSFERRK